MTPKILIVDDDPGIRRTLFLMLSTAYETHAAADGEEALRLLAREQPDIMMLDVVMEGLSGLDVLAAVIEASPKTTVVMLTGADDINVAQRSLQLGAVSYITKPFEEGFLRAEVERLLKARSGEGESYRPWRTVP